MSDSVIALLARADEVLTRADEFLHNDSRDVVRLRTLRRVRNRIDLAFSEGIGIYNDDHHALHASVVRQIQELEAILGPETPEDIARRERTVAGGLP